MAAYSQHEEQRQRRRRRLAKALLWGAAAVGIPALANALIARRNRRLDGPAWGRCHRYAWKFGEISFQQLGEGSPVLLVHSLGPGHDSDEWRVAGEILARKFRVFAMDLLGWGRSDKPKIHYDGEIYIQQIGDFLDDVVRERSALVAAGLPAAYAAQVAVDQPDLVSSLALVTPSGIESDGDEPDVRDALFNRLLRLPILGTSALNLYTSRSAISRHLRRETFAAPDHVDAWRIEHHYQSSHQPGVHPPLAAYLSGYLNLRMEESLPRLDAPTWLAWGRQATLSPVETADLWLRRIKRAELEVFENCGNLPHAESATRFTKKLEVFLSRHVE
jgi:pimeloyl-ACP methyl ester carboxylesterase